MSFLLILCHRCLLGSIPEGTFSITKELLVNTDQERKPINIHFDTNYLTKNDEKRCTKEGQIIQWDLGTYNCTKNDVLTPEKIKILEDSLENVKDLFKNLINVTRLKTKIAPSKGALDITFKSPKVNTDLYIMVVSRPFGPENLDSVAIGTTSDISSLDGRPIGGSLYINPCAIPNKPSSYKKGTSRSFINGITHELFHILGIRRSLMHTWINRTTGLPYESFPITSYISPKYKNKKFVFLHTPAAIDVAAMYFNRTYFADGLLSGIELEDDPSPINQSHPEARIYSPDIMAAETAGTAIISQISLAMLLDTGWYDVNFELTENLPPPLGGPLDPPSLFSRHVACTKEQVGKKTCSAYLRYPAQCIETTKIECPGNPYFCDSQDFFDPNRTNLGGSRLFDYMIRKKFISQDDDDVYDTDRFCTNADLDGELAETGQEYTEESMCAMSSLNNKEETEAIPICYRMRCVNSSLYVIVSGNKYHCEYEGQKINVPGYKGELICPDPNFACYVKDYLGKKWSNPKLPPLFVMAPIDSFVKFTLAFVCSIIVLVIILSITWCCWPLPENMDISVYRSLPGGRRLASMKL